jgi:hypothetical protein
MTCARVSLWFSECGSDGGAILPTNGGAGHGGDDSRPPTPHKSAPAELGLDDSSRVEKASDISNFVLLTQSSRLQQSFDDIEGRGDTGSKCTSQATRDAMRDRIILLPRIHHLR